MAKEQPGVLVRRRGPRGSLDWQLRWTFNGKSYDKKHRDIYRHLDEVLKTLPEDVVPIGGELTAHFTLDGKEISSLRVDDPRVDRAREQLDEAERRAEEERLEAERRKGKTFARPDPWRREGGGQRHFHNPYNFVPAPEGQPGADNPLRHRPPDGHDRYHDKRWSGSLTVGIEVVTPLIVPDTARKHPYEKQKDHFILPLLTGPRGEPALPVTSFKGALRSAYEAVTNSRMGVFRGHDTRLGRRMGTEEGLAMVPARVNDTGDGIELFMGTLTPRDSREWKEKCPGQNRRPPGNLMYAAWLPRYFRTSRRSSSGPHLDRDRILYPDGTPDEREPQHGHDVACWLRKVRRRNFTYWRVEELRRGGDVAALSAQAPQGELAGEHEYVRDQPPIRAAGYVCATGQNFGRKHDERVFFVPEGEAAYPYPDGGDFEAWASAWKDLVADYRKVAEDNSKPRGNATPDTYLGSDPGMTALSRHVHEDNATRLAAKDLCYALVDAQGKVTGLYPVMISRELAELPPSELLADNLRPARRYDELSPADRVFGWVSQDGSEARGRNMYRGQLRIRTLDYDSCNPDAGPITDLKDKEGVGLPLAILGQPKPQQARFYAARDAAGTPFADHAKREDMFYRKGGNGLRGRKVYPHHRRTLALDGYWDGPEAFGNHTRSLGDGKKTASYREYARAGGVRDNQNRTIEAWVNPGVRFTAVIDVVNLDAAEIGALIWLLILPEDHHLRLGLGKPLGFGSVRLTLEDANLCDPEAIRAEYASLTGTDDTAGRRVGMADIKAGSDPFVPAFRGALVDSFGGDTPFDELELIRAWRNAATGFDDDAPVHYPRVGDNTAATEKGENFKWFVQNEREVGKRQYALDPLWAPAGLPFLKE